MWKCVVFILYTLTILVRSYEDQWLAVPTAQGVVHGRTDPDFGIFGFYNIPYATAPTGPHRFKILHGRMEPDGGLYAFYNIPYATAPTGPHRFKAPLPPPVFLTPFYAVDSRIICPQRPQHGEMRNMREDCLVANVFVPNTPQDKLPVLVIVHGGAYQRGYGEQDKFKELAKTKKIIVVTFNYRLGVHGFLCLGTEGAPGNAGLKDQVALLRWVNTNIRNFGGNPDDVTIAACGAGSGSIDFLTLSTITKGLFKKAIMESGVSTGAVGVQIDPIENAKTYAKLLGFNGEDLSSLEDFYKSARFEQLFMTYNAEDTFSNNQNVPVLFVPCVESDIGQERVVFNAPYSILKQGNYTKIPLMYGFTNMDGARHISFDDWEIVDQMNVKFSDFLPSELHFDSEAVKEEVAQRVKHFYFGDNSVSDTRDYIRYITDVLFVYPMLRSLTTRVEALGDKIYLFEYSFVDGQTEDFPYGHRPEAEYCHQFIAVMDEDVTSRTDEYKKMKETLREYWHSFILNGVPVSSNWSLPRWKPAGANRSPHMSLGQVIQLKDNFLDDTVAFWDTIYEEHYRGPVMSYITTSIPAPTTPTSEPDTDATDSDPMSNPSTDASSTFDWTTDASTTQSTTIALTIIDYGTGGAVSLMNSRFMILVIFLSFCNALY